MEEVFSSKYDVVYVDKPNRIVKNVWTSYTENMNWADFKEELLALKKIVVENKTYGILGNTMNLNYAIIPEQQEWIAENYFPEVIAAGLKKYAIIVSMDMITELSVQQTIEENSNAPFDTRYFDNESDARDWLLIK